MTADLNASVKMRRVLELEDVHLRITVVGLRAFTIRCWFARWFFWAGGKIVGVPVTYDFRMNEGDGDEG